MNRESMTSLLVAAVLILAVTGTSHAAVQFWVVGNLVTNSCDIVSQSPVVNPQGPVWFGTGPFKSHDDAKAAPLGHIGVPEARSSRILMQRAAGRL